MYTLISTFSATQRLQSGTTNVGKEPEGKEVISIKSENSVTEKVIFF